MSGPAESDAVIANPLRAAGLVDAAALEQGRQFQRENGGLLSEALLHLGLVREGEFLKIFAEFYNTKFVKAEKLKALRLDPELIDKMGARVAERLRMCPIRFDEEKGELHVVAAVPLASTVEPEARQLFEAHTVLIYVATAGSVNALIRRWFYRELDAFEQVSANGAGPIESRPKSVVLDGDAGTGTEIQQSATTQVTKAEEIVDEGAAPTAERAALPSKGEPMTLPPTGLRAPLPPPREPEVATRQNNEAVSVAALRRENARYRIAEEFSRKVPQERSVESMVQQVLQATFELLPAEGAAVALSGDAVISRGRRPEQVVEVPSAIIDQALGSNEGVLVNNALVDKRFSHSESLMIRGVRSAMAVPMRARGRTLGVLYVDSISTAAAFGPDDLPLLDSIGTQAAIMLDNAQLIARVKTDVETRHSLERFLSSGAVDEVLAGRTPLKVEGQKSEVTVLFADIKGFTRAAAELSPTEVVSTLSLFFEQMTEAVDAQGGMVDKFIGDCVMAVWGVPVARPDDPRRALSCALSMVERVRGLKLRGKPLEIGIGVNTGDAVLGAIGSKRRLEYTGIGASINLASRLCGIARSGEILLTADTVMRAGSGVYTEQGEPVFIKGVDGALQPFVLKGVAPSIHQQPLDSHVGDETLRGVPAVPNRKR
jgi:adenylate cyclase